MAKRPASDSPSKADSATDASAQEPATPSAAGKVNKAEKPGKKDKPKAHDGGWRETIESLAMAVILALLFKGYVAEAFVIPTGSMAPTLEGRHKDTCCPQCGYWYQATASDEVDRQGFLTGQHVVSGTCPICRYTQTFDPNDRPNDGSFSGDRIIVSKFAYEIEEPERWDVIVFKYPQEATQNYIKRLVGLPGEHLTIVGGNVYFRDAKEPEGADRIARKPPHKLTAMLQIVDDSDYIPPALTKVGWPSRWRESTAPEGKSAWKTSDGGKSFACENPATGLSWLRYRHLAPTYDDWELIALENRLPPDVHQRPGQLITDLYAYNTSVTLVGKDDGTLDRGVYSPPYQGNHTVRLQDVPDRLRSSRGDQVRYDPSLAGPGIPCDEQNLGNHWVDDIAVECLAEIQDATGTVALDLVRAGIHYQCTIDVATGKATLSRTNAAGKELPFSDEEGSDVPNPQATTIVKEPGFYRLRLTNCDHQVMLFINGRAIAFEQPTFYTSPRVLAPQWTSQDALDLEPAGIGVTGTRAKLSHLKIYRDKYYIAISTRTRETTDYATFPAAADGARQPIQDFFGMPEHWTSSRLFDPENRPAAEFEIGPDQYFPMGDNSPGSYDGRYWEPSDYVHRDLLIGKALLIYWPHSWNRPPFMPHFQRMGRIR